MSKATTICAETGKIRWRKRSGAHRHAKKLDRKTRTARNLGQNKGSEAYVYPCEHCGGFHVATGNRARWRDRGRS